MSECVCMCVQITIDHAFLIQQTNNKITLGFWKLNLCGLFPLLKIQQNESCLFWDSIKKQIFINI